MVRIIDGDMTVSDVPLASMVVKPGSTNDLPIAIAVIFLIFMIFITINIVIAYSIRKSCRKSTSEMTN